MEERLAAAEVVLGKDRAVGRTHADTVKGRCDRRDLVVEGHEGDVRLVGSSG